MQPPTIMNSINSPDNSNLAISNNGCYVLVKWSQPLANTGTAIVVPTDILALPIRNITLVRMSASTVPVSAATHTSYVVHWPNQDTLVATDQTGKPNLSDIFYTLNIRVQTYETSHNFAHTHTVAGNISDLRFWLTYEDGSVVTLIPADSLFVFEMLLYASN